MVHLLKDLPDDDVQHDHCCYDASFDVIIDPEGQGHCDE